MQAIAGWINLSETTFVLPATDPAADYRLRIFTPRSELPFAGHSTIGSAHAILRAGGISPKRGVLTQECGQGLVKVAFEGEGQSRRIVLELPQALVVPLDPADIDELEAILDVPVIREAAPSIVDVGAKWLVAQLASAELLLTIKRITRARRGWSDGST